MIALWFHFFAEDSLYWKKVNPRSVADKFCSPKTTEHSIKHVAERIFHNKLQLNKDTTEFMIKASKRNLGCRVGLHPVYTGPREPCAEIRFSLSNLD